VYGAPTIRDRNGASVSQSAVGSPYLFTGRELDPETGLFYYRARHYDSGTGRFLQRDPLGYLDGFGLLEYVRSSPASSVDPMGTISVKLAKKIAKVLVKAVKAVKAAGKAARETVEGDHVGAAVQVAEGAAAVAGVAEEVNEVLSATEVHAATATVDEDGNALVEIEVSNPYFPDRNGSAMTLPTPWGTTIWYFGEWTSKNPHASLMCDMRQHERGHWVNYTQHPLSWWFIEGVPSAVSAATKSPTEHANTTWEKRATKSGMTQPKGPIGGRK